MKVVQINATCGTGSTGKICVGISKLLTMAGVENYILYSLGQSDYPLGIKCSNEKYIKFQALKTRLLGNYGFNSKKATKKIINELVKIKPDIVHLHNIHGHDCHLEMLVDYLKSNDIKIVWTFHDCWAFTGYCTHFMLNKCDNWQTECCNCVQYKNYSWFRDKSCYLFKKKKDLLTDLDMTVVTPSIWLGDIVRRSFLKGKDIKVINNGIDISVFKPVESSGFRNKFNIPKDKKIILGVAFGWGYGKGLDVFFKLADQLDDNKYQIVLVGTDDDIDNQLPDNVISIHRTNNQQELAEIYAAADVFVNPTREDNYPTVNMESIACGTPVITFMTGGSHEIIDEFSGTAVSCDDIEVLKSEIITTCSNKQYFQEGCLNKAKAFNQIERFKEYLELYEGINVTGTQRD